jgi:hypothetical protein
MDKYKKIGNEGNYDASCMLTSLPVSDLEICKCLIFVAQSIQNIKLKNKIIYSV